MKISLQTEKHLTYTLPLWTDLEKYRQIIVDTYFQPSCSLRMEVCGLLNEEEGLQREGDSPLIPTVAYKTAAFLMALNITFASIVVAK